MFSVQHYDRRMDRRELLTLGSLSTLGLSLPGLLAREALGAHGPARRRARACILVFMEGGPSHVDLFDLKPAAPAEVRGIFQPIPTTVPGLHIADQLPLLARQMHRVALVRSVTHRITDHNAGTYYAMTGRYPMDGSRLITTDAPGNFPPYGAVLAKLRPTRPGLPAFVHLPEVMSNLGVNIAGQSAGFLGGAYDPFVAGDPSLPGYRVPGMAPTVQLSRQRLGQRGALLGHVEQSLGRLANDPALERMSGFYRQAFDLITSPEARRAFDLSREPQSVRDRYGFWPQYDRALEARQFGGLPHLGQSMLLARRLIEAGVRLVTVITGRRYCQAWDTHRQHFDLLKHSLCPPFDRAFSALLEDMAVRGLLDDTLVVAMGEFGRTPKLGQIVSGAGATANGRDHWPFCYSVMFAGAGIPGGMVFGASDRQGAYPSLDPVAPEDLTATIYTALGLPADAAIYDNLRRPHHLLLGQPIPALVG